MNTFLKNLILVTYLLLLISNQITAQECGTQLLPEQVKYMNDTRIPRTNTNLSLFSNDDETVNLQIAAHIIRDSNRTDNLDLTRLDEAMADLNTLYDAVNFRFNICSINYIDNDEYAGGISLSHTANSVEYQMASPHLVQGAINVFFIPEAPYCGWASFPSYKNDYGKDWIVMRSDEDCLNNGSTFAHEVGHYFNLYHTHQGKSASLNIWEDELVSRSNCGPNIGDELCDTPADPQGMHIGQGERYALWKCADAYTCEFSNNNVEEGCGFTDSNGDLYKPDSKNVMSYSYKYCRTQFSPQQIERMQQSYLFDRDYLNTGICIPDCDNLTIVYDWLEEVTCQNGLADITIYKYNEVFNYLDIQNSTERNLYLSNGELHCSGSTVETCLAELGLTEILAECNIECGSNTCSDSNACNFGEAGNCIYSEPNYNCAGECLITVDCENVCGGNALPGTPCDDGDDSTINDRYDSNCICVGDPKPNPSCIPIFEKYTWIENEIACNEDEIKVYYYSESWNFIEIQSLNARTFYLSDATKYCQNQIDACMESFGLTEITDECICTKDCNAYGCTDENASNYNPNADCEDNSCIYICEDANACNFGAEEPCDYGNAACSNPCDKNTCPLKSCENIFEEYTWLNELLTCKDDEVWVYNHSSGWQFIEVQSSTANELYLSDGTSYCTGSQVAVCKESFGLMNPIDECVCDESTPSPCEDPNACNFGEAAACTYGNAACPNPCDESTCTDCDKYTGTIFYEDCDGTTFRFVETDGGQIFDPYFDLVDLQAYNGQRIRFDYINNTDVELPCNVAEKAIYFTCLEIIEDDIPEPDCNKYTGTIFYEDCGGSTFRFVETDDGQIYDPYFHLVDLEIYDGQTIKFDFIDNNEVITPCNMAQKAITITCIEEIKEEKACDDVFSHYPWLTNKVDPNNCNGESITVFTNGTHFFIYISNPNNGDLYLDAGYDIFYGYDTGDFSLPEAYDIEEIAKWTCGCTQPNNQTKTNKPTQTTVKKTSIEKTFNIYPNPTKGKVYIEVDNVNIATQSTISIFDLNGKIVKRKSLMEKRTTIDVSHLPKGIYMVEVQNNQNDPNTHNIQKLLIE